MKILKRISIIILILCLSISFFSLTVFAADKPAKPTISSIKVNNGVIALKWNEIEGADGYQIKRATSIDGNYKSFATVEIGTKVKYTTRQQAPGTYYFKIRAYTIIDGKTVYGDYSPIRPVTVAYPPLWEGKWYLDQITYKLPGEDASIADLAPDASVIEFLDDNESVRFVVEGRETMLVLIPIAGTNDEFYLLEEESGDLLLLQRSKEHGYSSLLFKAKEPESNIEFTNHYYRLWQIPNI